MMVCTQTDTGRGRKKALCGECAHSDSPVAQTLPIISFASAPLTGYYMTGKRPTNPQLIAHMDSGAELHKAVTAFTPDVIKARCNIH